VDFTYPLEAEQFRKELRSWLSAVRPRRRLDRGDSCGPVAPRPSRSSAASGFTWEHDAHLYLERLLGFSRFMGSAGNYQQRIGREMAGTAS
jgi:hypothetical protein